jgi:CheY-like chemotaxis protein
MNPIVLIANHDKAKSIIYQRILVDRFYNVEVAADGLACLARLRRRRPAALVLDADLPWGGGDGVLAWLREEGSAAGIGVVVTAAAGSPPGAAARQGPPVVHVLTEPFPLAALLEAVQAALAAGQAARAQEPIPARPEFAATR